MSKTTDSKVAIQNVQDQVVDTDSKVVWILTARYKKTKEVVNLICKDGPATDKAVAYIKANGMTFITLTTEDRVRSFLNGNPVKDWVPNKNALMRRGVLIDGLYNSVLDYLDNTEESARWFLPDGSSRDYYLIPKSDKDEDFNGDC